MRASSSASVARRPWASTRASSARSRRTWVSATWWNVVNWPKVAELYGNLQKANRLGELERSITEEKAFAYLLSQSTVDEATS